MAKLGRIKTSYPGVYYIEGAPIGPKGQRDRIYYIFYRRNGKQIEEKVGTHYRDDMTPARASQARRRRIQGREMSNQAHRAHQLAIKAAEANKWTINRLWEDYKARKPNLKGIVTDQNRFLNYIKPPFGEKEPSEIIPLDVDRLRLKLLKSKSPGTVKNVLELLRRIINFGVKKNFCDGPGFTIEMPKVNNIKTEDLSPEQLAALLDAIENDPNIQAGNLMKMVLYTGMRRGELFRLKWDDIDFERGFIWIRNPKGGVDEKIPLNDSARKLLDGHERTGSEYVFPGRGGKQRRDINHQVNRIKEAAGLPKEFRALHGLRHVYASMLASSGQVDMYTLQKLLTHKSPQMTQRYAHLKDETLKEASNLAGSLIDKALSQVDDGNVIPLGDKASE